MPAQLAIGSSLGVCKREQVEEETASDVFEKIYISENLDVYSMDKFLGELLGSSFSRIKKIQEDSNCNVRFCNTPPMHFVVSATSSKRVTKGVRLIKERVQVLSERFHKKGSAKQKKRRQPEENKENIGIKKPRPAPAAPVAPTITSAKDNKIEQDPNRMVDCFTRLSALVADRELDTTMVDASTQTDDQILVKRHNLDSYVIETYEHRLTKQIGALFAKEPTLVQWNYELGFFGFTNDTLSTVLAILSEQYQILFSAELGAN